MSIQPTAGNSSRALELKPLFLAHPSQPYPHSITPWIMQWLLLPTLTIHQLLLQHWHHERSRIFDTSDCQAVDGCDVESPSERVPEGSDFTNFDDGV